MINLTHRSHPCHDCYLTHSLKIPRSQCPRACGLGLGAANCGCGSSGVFGRLWCRQFEPRQRFGARLLVAARACGCAFGVCAALATHHRARAHRLAHPHVRRGVLRGLLSRGFARFLPRFKPRFFGIARLAPQISIYRTRAKHGHRHPAHALARP